MATAGTEFLQAITYNSSAWTIAGEEGQSLVVR